MTAQQARQKALEAKPQDEVDWFLERISRAAEDGNVFVILPGFYERKYLEPLEELGYTCLSREDLGKTIIGW